MIYAEIEAGNVKYMSWVRIRR